MKRISKAAAVTVAVCMLLSVFAVSAAAANISWIDSPRSILAMLFGAREEDEASELGASMGLASVDSDGNTVTYLNHAPDADVSVSGDGNEYGAGNLNDDDTSTAWYLSASRRESKTAYAVFTWDQSVTLSSIRASLAGYNPSRHTVTAEYSLYSYGDSWNSVSGNISGNTFTADIGDDVSGIRRIRLTFRISSASSSSTIGAYEIYAVQDVVSELKYFPVTLYNYSTNDEPISGKGNINNTMHLIELASDPYLKKWEGIYFGAGNPPPAYQRIGSYAAYNWWTGNLSGYDGNDFYGSITGDSLDPATGTPVFPNGEPGLFNSDTSDKNVYTNVGLPFIYYPDTNGYSFDSNKFNAHFENKSYSSNTNLVVGQKIYADGAPGFFPFNESGDTDLKFHFGMQTVVPFYMNSNGRIDASDDGSAPVKFAFSGDDDVWVFIDDTLVLDIGGVHNAISGTLDFAENTITMAPGAGGTTTDASTGKVFREEALFNVEDGEGNLIKEGLLGVTREYFAAQGEHTLKIFYLERGKGQSNCKIEFNLPLNDQLEIEKHVNTDGLIKDDPSYAGLLDAVNSTDFSFTLYNSEGIPQAGMTYLLFKNDAFAGTGTTDGDGRFTLRNGWKARFALSAFSSAGSDSFYAVESTLAGGDYELPSWDYYLNFSHRSSANGYTSPVTDVSALTTVDHMRLVCTNVIMPYSVIINPETFVLDYGLPVILDVLSNDSQYGRQLLLSDVSGAVNGIVEIVRKLPDGSYEAVPNDELSDSTLNEYRYIRYTPNRFLESIDTLTYTLITNRYDGETGDFTSGTATSYATVIPATSVHYEENFNGIQFTGGTSGQTADPDSQWSSCGDTHELYQDMGAVGKPGNPAYGSDPVYLASSSGDTAGSSMKVTSAASGTGVSAPYFTYTFTGTGTTVYMRTDTTSGWIKVYLTAEDGTVKDILVRSLYYGIDRVGSPLTGDTIYNIPVYNIDGLEYGTYTVKVVCLLYIESGNGSSMFINASGEHTNTFYLDGIRVYNPMGYDNADAENAYELDGENDVSVTELRDKLLADETVEDHGGLVWEDGFVLFTDTDGSILTAEEYQTMGPKNELYLADGQSVSFDLSDWFRNNPDYRLFLGAKAPEGSPGQSEKPNELIVSYIKDGEEISHTVSISSTADCYYEITSFISRQGYTGVITVTASTDSIISLTNLKVTGAPYTITDN